MKRNVLIIGAGGVAQVVAHKCATRAADLGDLHIASRTIAKCEAIRDDVEARCALDAGKLFHTHALDATDADAVTRLIEATGCRIVINVAAVFVNMAVMTACLRTGAAYIDTALYEDPAVIVDTPPWYAEHEWKRAAECAEAGVTVLLGAGFDPGVVNAYARLAEDRYLDTVASLDIVDVNAGRHGRWFATNFDPEINFREFVSTVWSRQEGEWRANAMFEVARDFDLPEVGEQRTYLTSHDEVHSLAERYGEADIRFWMGFNDRYIQVFEVLKNLGLLSEQPVTTDEGQTVVPLKVVKACLPDPASLAPDYTGRTCIGTLARGRRDGREREVFVYNVADHERAFAEVGSQAISYTAGVPPVAAALLIAEGTWDAGRMVHVEDLPPEPFVEKLAELGLPTRVRLDGEEIGTQFERT